MKLRTLLTLSLSALTATSVLPSLWAQDDAPSSNVAPGTTGTSGGSGGAGAPQGERGPGGGGRGGRGMGRGQMGRGALGALSPEEREKFQAARKIAETDPAVVAADQDRKAVEKEYRDTVSKLLSAKDPALAALFEKQAMGGGRRNGPPPAPSAEGSAPGAPADGEKGNRPSREDREKLRDAIEELSQNESLKTLGAKRKVAGAAHQKAMKEALLKADPELASVIDKVGEGGGWGGPGGGRGGRGERGGRGGRGARGGGERGGPDAPGAPSGPAVPAQQDAPAAPAPM